MKFLIYRCDSCHRIMTCDQIWERMRRGELPCRQCYDVYRPTNPTLWEELTTPAIWKVWWKYVASPTLSRWRARMSRKV